jgi:Putative amidase domain
MTESNNGRATSAARFSPAGRRRLFVVAAAAVIASGLPAAASAAASGLPTAASAASKHSVASFVTGYFRALDHQMMPTKTALRLGPAAITAISRYYPAGAAATQTSRALLSYEVRTTNSFHAWVRMHGFNYKSFSTRPTMVAMKFSASGQQANVVASTVTTFRWSSGAAPNLKKLTRAKAASIAQAAKIGRYYGPGQIVTSKVETTHRMHLIRQDGTWRVQSDWYLDPFNQTVGPNHATPVRLPATTGTASGTTPVPATVRAPADVLENYENTGAAAYADHYWSHYNTMFPNCNSACGGGGDCTNFVSQSLSYYGNTTSLGKGGDLGPEYHSSDSVDKSWIAIHNGANDMSLPWDNANDSKNWVTGNPWGSRYDFGYLGKSATFSAAKTYDINDMVIGDLHYYHWSGDSSGANHAAIAVAYASDGETLVDAHNTNSYHVNWDLGASGATYYMVRMYGQVDAPAGS